jgi:hypothetical protein
MKMQGLRGNPMLGGKILSDSIESSYTVSKQNGEGKKSTKNRG